MQGDLIDESCVLGLEEPIDAAAALGLPRLTPVGRLRDPAILTRHPNLPSVFTELWVTPGPRVGVVEAILHHPVHGEQSNSRRETFGTVQETSRTFQ